MKKENFSTAQLCKMHPFEGARNMLNLSTRETARLLGIEEETYLNFLKFKDCTYEIICVVFATMPDADREIIFNIISDKNSSNKKKLVDACKVIISSRRLSSYIKTPINSIHNVFFNKKWGVFRSIKKGNMEWASELFSVLVQGGKFSLNTIFDLADIKSSYSARQLMELIKGIECFNTDTDFKHQFEAMLSVLRSHRDYFAKIYGYEREEIWVKSPNTWTHLSSFEDFYSYYVDVVNRNNGSRDYHNIYITAPPVSNVVSLEGFVNKQIEDFSQVFPGKTMTIAYLSKFLGGLKIDYRVNKVAEALSEVFASYEEVIELLKIHNALTGRNLLVDTEILTCTKITTDYNKFGLCVVRVDSVGRIRKQVQPLNSKKWKLRTFFIFPPGIEKG